MVREEIVRYYCDVCGDEMNERDDDITVIHGSTLDSGAYHQFDRSDACSRCAYRLRIGISTLVATLKKDPNLNAWDIDKELYNTLKTFYGDDS